MDQAYQDKIGRTGLRIGDILSDDFKTRYQEVVTRHQAVFDAYGVTMELAELESEFFKAVDQARELTIIDSEYYLNDAIKAGKHILAEGAQGSMLDVDFGTYPFVTSSTTLVAGALQISSPLLHFPARSGRVRCLRGWRRL